MRKQMTRQREAEIEEEFTELIREKMTDYQFWEWAQRWMDVDMVIEICENWDIELKEESIDEIKQIMKKKKK